MFYHLCHPSLQSILLWSFSRWGLMSYLPGLTSNLHPPYLSLPSSYENWREPAAASWDSDSENKHLTTVTRLQTFAGHCFTSQI
jgi:hypothetical protein